MDEDVQSEQLVVAFCFFFFSLSFQGPLSRTPRENAENMSRVTLPLAKCREHHTDMDSIERHKPTEEPASLSSMPSPTSKLQDMEP